MKYRRDKIARLLEEHLTGAVYKPQEEQPRTGGGSSDPRRASDGMTEMADIQRAWKGCGLAECERYALYWDLIGWPMRDITQELRRVGWIDGPSALTGAYAALARFLNGKEVEA